MGSGPGSSPRETIEHDELFWMIDVAFYPGPDFTENVVPGIHEILYENIISTCYTKDDQFKDFNVIAMVPYTRHVQFGIGGMIYLLVPGQEDRPVGRLKQTEVMVNPFGPLQLKLYIETRTNLES